MKKYSENIEKLYENVGFEKIEKGKIYVTQKGGKVTINDIFIDAVEQNPEVYVDYAFELVDGKTGTETNKYGVVVDMIRNM